MTETVKSKLNMPMIMTILVTTLGYFVDAFDIFIFSATRLVSLKDIGVPADKILDTGIFLLNLQMIGMVIGGVVFGIAGDKLGRTRVMMFSILTYALGTLANAFVTNVESFAILRFLSGFGLAGELGLGVTLISEILSKERRGIGVGIMILIGVGGVIAAALASQVFDWRTCYIIGGVMGLLLLVFRMKIIESDMFKNIVEHSDKGNLMLLFKSRERFMRFFWCVMLGLPIWFVVGILMTFAPEILSAANLPVVSTATLMIYCYSAIMVGDFVSVLLCQVFKKRKPVFVGFIIITMIGAFGLFYLPGPLEEIDIKLIFAFMGFGVGSWVLMSLISAESFGTNLRATVATSVPNFVRASVVPMTLLLSTLKANMPLLDAVMIVGGIAFILPLIALTQLKETFGTSLEFLEE